MNDNPKTPQEDDTLNLGETAFAGAAIMIATRFVVRLLGLVSVTVLARLLTPEDFGLFGTAALILGFFLLLKETGFSEAVVKEKNLEKQDIDTLWTLRLILSVLIGIAVYFLSPLIANFLKDVRVIPLLQIMAIIPLIDALASPAAPMLLRELKFKTAFMLKSGNKVIQVTTVIIVAIILKSHWALVFGAILSSSSNVVITHFIRPYKPRLSLSRLSKHSNFAFWTYVRSLASYFSNTSDEYVIRSTASTAFFGIYHISRDLARVLIADIIGPVREAMLPALSRMKNDTKRHAAATANIFGAALIIATGLSFGIAMTADELVLVLLGNQWTEAGPFLTLLAIGTACQSIGEINQSSFATAGLQKKAAFFWVGRGCSYLIGCVLAGILYGPIAVAITYSSLSFLVLIIETRYLLNKLDSNISIFTLGLRPIIAGLTMVGALYILPAFAEWPTLAVLALKVGIGSSVYGAMLLLLWKLNNFSDGPENILYINLPARVQNLIPLTFRKQIQTHPPR
ncbi:lipopolysaccharide biosynthesis protein [Kordiimonas aquimaris]|uniref:lipopolysaccharide biosynthesis protein n=1 Tax=Kordiimonas aquimaris TaxID=707591 RepID=UPI0021D149C7|nr:lipopolysaccharide biosynthesis protein [Kordiimonas aquimaris]